MAMALSPSRALLLPLLPSCFRRLAHIPSPDEERPSGTPGPRPGRRIPGHGETVVIVDDDDDMRVGNVSPEELLAYEVKKREWIDEQKRSIAEAMQRAGGPDPRWNDNGGGGNAGGRKRNTFFLEELSAYEIKKRWWIAEQKRGMAKAKAMRGWSREGSRRSSNEPAKPRPPPVRVTSAGRFGPESDAAFLKAVIAAEKSGREGDSATQHGSESGYVSEMDEARLRRQRYLRHYCPFQREEEQQEEEVSMSSSSSSLEEEESVSEETKAAEPDDAAEVERKEPVQPANDPGTQVSTIEKNQGGGGDGVSPNKVPCPAAGGVRIRDDDYYAARREFLKGFHFTRD